MDKSIAAQRTASSHDRQTYWAGKAERKAQSEADRKLCPQPSARVLNLSYRQVAAAMREHDVLGPLNTPQAKRYRDGVDPVPDWLGRLLLRTHGVGQLPTPM